MKMIIENDRIVIDVDLTTNVTLSCPVEFLYTFLIVYQPNS